MRWCVFFLIILTSHTGIHARVTGSIATGLWSEATTWSNDIPQCGDTVNISTFHTVTIDAQIDLDESSIPVCAEGTDIFIDGVLHFNTGMKLYLACGSHVDISVGGSLTKGSGGGSSNIIDICGVTVWSAADGDVTGPAAIGPALPITLGEFHAEVISDVVHLGWTTLNETNNNYFTIERSKNLKNISTVTIVDGAGDSKVPVQYMVLDESPPVVWFIIDCVKLTIMVLAKPLPGYLLKL